MTTDLIRLFLRVELPFPKELADAVKELESYRPAAVIAAGPSYTVRTIGSTKRPQLASIAAALRGCVESATPFELELGAPQRVGRRLLAPVLNPEALQSLQAAVDLVLDPIVGSRDPPLPASPMVSLAILAPEAAGLAGWQPTCVRVDELRLVDTSRGEVVISTFALRRGTPA